MLGLRGVRLLTVIPELVDAQVRGLCEAVADLHEEGLDPRAEILVPLVADARELTAARHRIEAASPRWHRPARAMYACPWA